MKITIVGGGNIGTQFAAHCAEKGHEVIVHTSKPEHFASELIVQTQNGEVLHRGDIKCATGDDRIAFSNRDLLFITLPAYCMNDIAQRILPFAHADMMIGIIPGTGGGECAFRACIEKGATLFGLQRVPSVARLLEYGKSVCATGYRDKLFVASLPQERCRQIATIITDLFDIACDCLPCYLNLTLTPSNPILHTTRLRTIFADYQTGVSYKSVPLFYEEWSDNSSHLLFACDDEVQSICSTLNEFDLSQVKSLKIHYESSTPEALTRKIRSIEGFRGLKTPTVLQLDGYIPDLNSRYFTADFSYGLSILKQIAEYCHVAVPNIDETMKWYQRIAIHHDEFSFAAYGIIDRKSLCDFYSM